jgi:Tfp pilus assembly protein FimV
MNTNRKRIASGAVSVALVGGIVAAALTLGPAFAASQPAPAPTSTFDPASFSEFRETVDDAIAEAERVAAEAAAAEAARVEAERVAAEQAAAEQAARDAAARQAPAPQAPAPQAPAAPAQPGGDQQAGECREFNDAGECTAVYVP